MLEAFQASSASDSLGDGAAAMEGGTHTSRRSPGGGSGGLNLPMGPGVFLLLQVVLLVLAFMAGKASGGLGTVQAQGRDDQLSTRTLDGGAPGGNPSEDVATDRGSDPVRVQAQNESIPAPDEVLSTRPGRGARRPGTVSQRTSGQQPGETSAGSVGSVGSVGSTGSAADAAFADPANRFTLLVFTADGTDFGHEMTTVNQANLEAQGFAAITPRERGGKWLLHVGAYGSFAAAEQARIKVASAPGPDGRQTPYAGAYVVNITR